MAHPGRSVEGARPRCEEQTVRTERNARRQGCIARALAHRAGRRADRGRLAIAVSAAALLAIAVSPAPSLAAPKASQARIKYVSGRLSAPGYTIVVVGYNGKVVLSNRSSFRIAAPDSKVTLQLVNSHGLYAGPVVFGGSATKVITGIRAGTNVGTIVVVPPRGYAPPARRLAGQKPERA